MLREIIKPINRQLKIEIPQEYVDKKIEILILPFFEMESSTKKKGRGYDEKLMKLFKNAPNVKIDKKVNIDALMNEVNDVVL
jgi:hypothetical protein